MEKIRKHHILIAKPNILERSRISAFLSQAGYVFSEAISGESILKLLKKNPKAFDLLLLHHNLCHFQGVYLLQELFILRKKIKLPCVVMTEKTDRANIKAVYQYGVREIIFKLVEQAILLNIVKHGSANANTHKGLVI